MFVSLSVRDKFKRSVLEYDNTVTVSHGYTMRGCKSDLNIYTECTDSDNMMLVVELVVVFVVNFAIVRMIIKGVEEQFIPKQPDLQSLF